MKGYDIIGDIHGHADALRRLLAKLEYTRVHGTYRHPRRQAVFLGDLIDRGPQIPQTLDLVRRMVEAGAALCVMGNHEYNALCWHTENSRGGWLREHSAQNRRQHFETLKAYSANRTGWRSHLRWLQTLPLYLELPGLRVVHACWDADSIAVLGENPYLDGERLQLAAEPLHPLRAAVHQLLKGPEIPLPSGHATDKEGRPRDAARIRWWMTPAGMTYRDTCFSHADTLPETPVAAAAHLVFRPYAGDQPPVFIGHYWLPPEMEKTPLQANLACLDYSAGSGGPLVAYRWSGEQELRAENFVSTEERSQP